MYSICNNLYTMPRTNASLERESSAREICGTNRFRLDHFSEHPLDLD